MTKQNNSTPQVQLSTLFLTGDSKPPAQLAVWGTDYLMSLNKCRGERLGLFNSAANCYNYKIYARQMNDYEASEGRPVPESFCPP
jgi:hypothetical protein